MSITKLANVMLTVSILVGVVYFSIVYIYTQQYVQDSNTTATKGALFTTTLNLEAYEHVSSGIDILGKFDRYSRSDRHSDVLTVYCKDYCKGK